MGRRRRLGELQGIQGAGGILQIHAGTHGVYHSRKRYPLDFTLAGIDGNGTWHYKVSGICNRVLYVDLQLSRHMHGRRDIVSFASVDVRSTMGVYTVTGMHLAHLDGFCCSSFAPSRPSRTSPCLHTPEHQWLSWSSIYFSDHRGTFYLLHLDAFSSSICLFRSSSTASRFRKCASSPSTCSLTIAISSAIPLRL